MLLGWFEGRLVSTACVSKHFRRLDAPGHIAQRHFSTNTFTHSDIIPLRKQLKDAVKASRVVAQQPRETEADRIKRANLARWELTVGIEIHAQLNTTSKLFSRASAEYTDVPNAATWPFDLAVPGSQPKLQIQVLLPALRAAIALGCKIQERSKFDRKHYFYHDQPSGYQITQYYEPFAKDGELVLNRQDGLSQQDGEKVIVGIKQLQLEQDTAKTQEQDDGTNLVDFNRSGHALIEIISLPQIHSPEAAAAYVRKVQSILYAVDAATTGMELGGLRADVNVSVRRFDAAAGVHSYSGVTGLGQRTEIKNLSSFKSVEDAVRAERDRQIDLLESGGTVQGETRGWSLSNPHVTRRLRGKEGEVDYRYMPDPDIAPLYLGADLVSRLRETLPPLPERLLDMLTSTYGLSNEDASAMLSLDDGTRLLWYQDIVACLQSYHAADKAKQGVVTANWVLHELGALLTMTETQWNADIIHPRPMADLITMLLAGRITGSSAKRLLRLLFDGDRRPVHIIAEEENLLFSAMTDDEYHDLAGIIAAEHPAEADAVRKDEKQAKGKLKFLLGQMMRQADRNRIEAPRAEAILQRLLSQQVP